MQEVEKVLGHEEVIRHLQNAVEKEQVSHSYIFAGEKGSGKKLLAKLFAMTLQCEEHKKEPCMHCSSCRKVMSRNHPDIIYVEHVKPTSIGIEEIREQLVSDVEIKPYTGPYKIYIVDEAEKMTVQAQNALLKTIEEPPAYAVILLLTTNPDGFLPTILSRCVQLKLKPLPDSMIRGYLTEKMGVSESQSELYAAFARGNLGKAKRLAESEDFRQSYEQILNILKNIRQMDISQLLDAIKRLKDENMDLHECLDIMQVWYRDGLMFKVTKDANLLIFKDEFSAMNEMSTRIGYDGFENILNAIDKARIRLDANVNMELALELMFLAMKENS